MKKPIFALSVRFKGRSKNKKYKPSKFLKWFIGMNIPIETFDKKGRTVIYTMNINTVATINKSREARFIRIRDLFFLSLYRLRGRLK